MNKESGTPVACVPMAGVACWTCGGRAAFAEVHPNGGVRTVHAYLDRDLKPQYTWCWPPEHQPLPGEPDVSPIIPPALELALEMKARDVARARLRRYWASATGLRDKNKSPVTLAPGEPTQVRKIRR